MDFLSLCACTFSYSSPYHGVSLCISYFDGSVSSLWLPSTSTSVVIMYSTISRFLSFIHNAMFPRILTLTNAMLCIASASHAYALGPPLGITHLPLGHTPFILVSTNNDRDTHDSWGFLLPYIPPCILLISDMALGISHGIFLAMPLWIWDVLSSPVAAPT